MLNIRLTSAARVHGITEGTAAHYMDNPPPGYVVDIYNNRAYLWKDGELLAEGDTK